MENVRKLHLVTEKVIFFACGALEKQKTIKNWILSILGSAEGGFAPLISRLMETLWRDLCSEMRFSRNFALQEKVLFFLDGDQARPK